MKTSISFLSSAYSFTKTMEKINASQSDFIHVDVMDGLFVNHYTPYYKEMMDLLKESPKPKEVHLMTFHLKQFIDVFCYIKPEIILYSLEATTKHHEIIRYIKSKNVKVGIAISPLSDLKGLMPYLKKIDMVLVMAVIPGYGGQKFRMETVEKVKMLKEIRESKKFTYSIHVDGGINANTILNLKESTPDRVVVGSYVCHSADFDEPLKKIKLEMK